jgi:hypothetical protein
MVQTTVGAPASTAEAKAAVRETRSRLTVRLAGTADHVQRLLTVPSSAETAARDRGVVGAVTRTIAGAGRASRAWNDAKKAGLVRRTAIAGMLVAIGVALAARTWHRRRDARVRTSSDADGTL